MTLTVRQLLENHTRGVNGETQVKQPLYFELPIPVINDMTDVEEYKKNLQEQIKSVNEFIKKEQTDAKAAAEQKAKDGNPDNKTPTNKEPDPKQQPVTTEN